MKIGFEHREQVYFLAGLIVFAGYVMYLSLIPKHHATGPATPSHPTAPHPGSKAIGWNEIQSRMPGVRL
jgi:hypothetical protein